MILSDIIIILILIFVRFSSMMMLIPIFSTNNMPNQIKVLFMAIMSYIFFINGQYNIAFESFNFYSFVLAIIFEFINGVSIGFVVVAITNAVYIAGQVVDTNIGFSMVNVISASNDEEVPVTANFYYMLMMVIFLLTNSHHKIIEAFSMSLQKTPLGVLAFNPAYVMSYNALIGETFIIGIKMALPIMLTILVSDIILGILSKAMPGLNVFVFGMPFKILIGLSVILLIFPTISEMMLYLVGRIDAYMKILLML